jgi:tRNA threonylcarbamoyladenosine biosynthesis protein TsaE
VDGGELHVRSAGPNATRAIARVVAGHLVPGDVVALAGELGAGKTCFVQGAADGLGVAAPVTSPTFVLVRQYTGRVPVVHCDVYRLDRLGDVLELGDEVLAPDVVTFVEWGDAIAALLPPDRLEVELRLHHGEVDGADDAVGVGSVDDEMDGADGEVRTVVLRLTGRVTDRTETLAAALRAAGHPPKIR